MAESIESTGSKPANNDNTHKSAQHGRSQMILLAHGSRDPAWCQTFIEGTAHLNAALLRTDAGKAQLAFMEMASPALEDCIGESYAAGVSSFQILPLFFAEGRHLKKDVPGMIEEICSRFPGCTIRLLPAVGLHDVFWQSLAGLLPDMLSSRNPA